MSKHYPEIRRQIKTCSKRDKTMVGGIGIGLRNKAKLFATLVEHAPRYKINELEP